MFQMSKQLFDQCWPVIAVEIQKREDADRLTHDPAPPSRGAAAEAGYVLGVAIGYALQVHQSTTVHAPVSVSIPNWQADACGGLNWPRISAQRTSPSLAISRR
ncbi:MAG: hypothetical protein Q8K23_05370 [Sulfuritalea sp.]|nr:hypothetical protein [Sulfuritalea sp.]